VKFASSAEVSKAIELNGVTLLGRQLRIDHAGNKPTPGSGRGGSGGRGSGRGGRSDRGGISGSTPSKTLFIRNLSYSTTEDTIKKLFKAAQNVSLPMREDGSLKGFGFIDFENENAAESALKKMNGKAIDGRDIRLEFKRSQDRDSSDLGGRGRGRGRGTPRGRGGRGGSGRGGSGRGGFNKSKGFIQDYQGKKLTFSDSD
jgi:nucleolin